MPSGNNAEASAHQSDAVEVSLFARAFFGALTGLVAFVEQLDLLELLERLGQQATDMRWKSAIMPSICATLRRFSST